MNMFKNDFKEDEKEEENDGNDNESLIEGEEEE